MIKLANTPYDGSPVEVYLKLEDALGNPVNPVTMTWTLLAHKDDSWNTYFDDYKVSLDPVSETSFYTDRLLKKYVDDKMKLVLEYTVLRQGHSYPFIEEFEFELLNNPMNYISISEKTSKEIVENARKNDDKTIVKVTSMKASNGTLSLQPIVPEFIVTMNTSCDFSTNNFKFVGNDTEVNSKITSTSDDRTTCVIKPSENLAYQTDYEFVVSGVKAEIGGTQSEAASLQFSTELEFPVLQSGKEVTVVRNGIYEITPDQEYVGLAKASVEVAIPIEDETEKTISENGSYELTAAEPENIATRKVNLKVNVRPTLQKKEVEVTSDGVTVITPDDGNQGLSRVTVVTSTVVLYAYKCKAYTFWFTRELVSDKTYFGTCTIAAKKGKFEKYEIMYEDGVPTCTISDYKHHLIRSEDDDILRDCARGDLPKAEEASVEDEGTKETVSEAVVSEPEQSPDVQEEIEGGNDDTPEQ